MSLTLHAVVCRSCGCALIRAESGGWYHEGTGLAGWVDDPTDAAHRALPIPGIPGCVCAHHLDGSTTTSMCPLHAGTDPCLTESWVTGRRRKGTIRRGVCSACGHGGRS